MKNPKEYFSKSTIIISIFALAIGFIGGFFFSKNKVPSFPGGDMIGGQPQMSGGQVGRVNSGDKKQNSNSSITQTSNLKQTMGEIISADDSSITITTPDGGSKIILVSDSTIINKAAQGSKTDLTTGSKVSITGDSNTDGSITSKSININSDTITPIKN